MLLSDSIIWRHLTRGNICNSPTNLNFLRNGTKDPGGLRRKVDEISRAFNNAQLVVLPDDVAAADRHQSDAVTHHALEYVEVRRLHFLALCILHLTKSPQYNTCNVHSKHYSTNWWNLSCLMVGGRWNCSLGFTVPHDDVCVWAHSYTTLKNHHVNFRIK